MASDYEISTNDIWLPESNGYFEDNYDQISNDFWNGSSNDSYLQNQANDIAESWFVNSGGGGGESNEGGDSIWGGLWDWAKSPTGNKVIGGIVDGLYSALASKNAPYRSGGSSGGGAPTAAALQHARILKHNESINKPVKVNLRKFK